MKTFEELKEKITPEFIKGLCELAEGFKIEGENETFFCNVRIDPLSQMYFPLLLHRAVEEIWKQNIHTLFIHNDAVYISVNKENDLEFTFKNYLPCHLTACEMAILDCLLEVLV